MTVLQPRTMLRLAPLLLIVGAISLIYATGRLFQRALDGGMPDWHLAWIIPVFAVLGAVKARFVMRKRMRQNVARFRAATERMWPWQLYPPQLLAFIVTMVVLMNVLRRVLADEPVGLGVLGGVDLAVAVALVVASREYWQPAGTDHATL
jgi:hypothetical protein